MKKAIGFIVIFIIFLAFKTHAQTPDNLGTDVANGTYTSYAMTNLGKFNQTRLLSTASSISGTIKWEFYSCSGGCFVSNWRPYAPNLILAGYNQDIPPAGGTASALYNSASGGYSGYLPAVTGGSYYTFNVMNNPATASNDMGVLQTSYNPVTINSAKALTNCGGASVTVSSSLSAMPNAAEYFYVRWSTNSFTTSTVTQMSVSGTTATATFSPGANMQFYVFSSSVNALISTGKTDAYYDTQTLNINNNGGSNYSYIFGALSGLYTVNSSLATSGINFKLLADAVNELDNRGISAGVTFNVNTGLTEVAPAGGYLIQYCASIPAANQSSATKTVTFKKTGAGVDPLITAQTGVSYTSDAIFTLVGTKYVTIDGIDLVDVNTTGNIAEMEAGYAILQQTASVGAQNNTIQNCMVTLKTSSYDAANLSSLGTGPVGILVDGVTYNNYGTSIKPSSLINACNNNAFYSNTIQNCAVGIGLNQFTQTPIYFQQNNIVGDITKGNIIQNFGSSPGAAIFSYGINANYQNNISVGYNTVNNIAGGGSVAACNLNGVYVGGNDGTVNILNNIISLVAAPPAISNIQVTGIGTYGTTSTISGNTIQSCNISTGDIGAFYGIFNGGLASSLTISGNTIGNTTNPNTFSTTNGAVYLIACQRSGSTLINVTGNLIQNNTTTISASMGALQFIGNQGTVTTLNVTGNTIKNNTVSGTDPGSFVFGIVNANTVTNLTFGTAASGNLIQNNSFNTTGTIAFIDPTYLGTKNPGTESIVNNTILSNTNSSLSASNVYLIYNSTTSNNITCSNNILGNNTTPAFTESNSCSGTAYGYYNTGAATGGTETISGNSLNISLKTSGAVKGFYSNTATAQAGVITGNAVYNFINSGTGSFYGFDFESHSATSSFNNNSISGLGSLATTGGVADYGFYILSPVQNIFSNTVSGITLAAASNANFFPLYAGSTSVTSPSSVYNNSITNITANGINFINAVQVSQTVATCNIYGNTVSGIAGNASQTGGIILNNSSGTTNCYQNNIYNLASTNTAAVVAGIDAVSGTTNNVYNNLISDLRATAASSTTTLSIRGMQADGGANAGFYYNTVYLNASSTGTNFGSAALFLNNSATALTMKDNILANASVSSGTQASVALQSIYALAAGTAPAVSFYTAASNNNVFYTTTSGYAYADKIPIAAANNKFQCSCSNITAFQSYISSRESNSIYELPPFANISSKPYDLSLPAGSSTGCYQGGIPVPSITTIDYAATVRSSTAPTIGAYELSAGTAADKTAPAISFTPASANCNNNVTFTANITDAGTGVNTATGMSPRVYYKKQSDANNSLATLNNNTVSGWKYVQASNTANPFSFTIDLSLLQGSISPGDVIQYFVIAQDNQGVPNVSVNSASLSNCINSVVLTGANFPVAAVANSFTIPPFPQNVTVTPSAVTVCQGATQSLTVSTSTTSPVPTYFWSPVTNLFTDAGATMPYVAASNYATVYTNTSSSITYVATVTVAGCSASASTVVTATSSNWIGAMSSDWNLAANWCANAVPSSITDVIIPNTAPNQPVIGLSGPNTLCKSITIQPGASLTMQSSYTLSIASGGSFTNSGMFTPGSANEAVIFSGTGSISGSTTFNNLTVNGPVTMNNDITVNKTASLNAGSSLILNGNTVNLSGSVIGSGTFTGSITSSMNIKGNLSASVGTVNFTAAAQTLNSLSIDRWNGTTVSNAVTLGSSLTTNTLSLIHGIISTGSNLLSLTSYAGLTVAGGIPWSNTQTNAYDLSYVATCDASGKPVSVAGPATPLTGNYGFQIKNIGTGGTTGDVYFPVGASFLPAGTLVTDPSPNRVMINNSGPSDNFNMIVNYGDILYTPKARVNRIWYINSANSTSINSLDRVTMRLFFVERTLSNWPLGENEIENTPAPFDFTNIALVEKDYNIADYNYIAIASGTDLKSFPNGTNNGKEVYAQYTVGQSADVAGNKFGIYEFNRFSITNPGGIILPVTVTSFRTYLQNNIVINEWITQNEVNLDHYNIERSANAVNFNAIGSVTATNNAQVSSYKFTDANPLTGKNYYRIKAINKDGSFTYTNIQLVETKSSAKNISIFPNPVSNNFFTLQMNNMPSGMYIIRILNAEGQQIINKTIENTGSSSSQTIQLPASTARGEYFISISGNDGETFRKLTLQ